MNLTIYDILSNLIPGVILYLSISILSGCSLEKIPEVGILAISYVLGYLNNSISSWIEDILFFTWGGKPSSRILDGKQIWKVKFYESKIAKDLLLKESKKQNPSNDELFNIAMRYANSVEYSRVREFNQFYAFSRSILVSILLSSLLFNIHYWINYYVFICFLVIVIILWLRTKQRAYYYSREVLNTYLSIKNQKNNN